MTRSRPSLSVAALCCGALLTPARIADANVEIGGTAGVHVFNDDNELGVEDLADAPSQQNAPLFGVRIGAYFTSIFGAEGEFGFVPTSARGQGFGVLDLTYRLHLIAQFLADREQQRVIPFVLAGAGAFSVVSSDNDDVMGDPARDVFEDTDGAFYVGVGAKYRFGGRWGLRADARLLIVPSSVNNPLPEPDESNVTTDFEALLSFYIDLGRPAPAGPPPIDDDPDRDGVRGAADACPAEPEDKDAFQDDDGCPEPDNDADGIADATDRCPLEPEDKDAFQDDDGCPEPDNDADGISDATDRCPAEPEDKDAFQDDDGCPDPDNDDDGVPDGSDRCPEQPETKNGYQDEDGCPDELPEQVKQFTGVIQGINFRVNSADLLPTSFRTLDKAVAVLAEFPQLSLEIQGHTDDVPIRTRKKYADNLELSQARAESVREYLIKKGIDPMRLTAKGFGDSVPLDDPAGLKGRKLTAARAKNRRVEFQLVTPPTPPASAPTPPAPPASAPTPPAAPAPGAASPAAPAPAQPTP